MISLDNIVYILRQEAEAVRGDMREAGLTERARRHKARQVHLLEQAIGSLQAYIRERERPLVPVYDVAGDDEPPNTASPKPTPTPAAVPPTPEGAWV